MAEEKATITDKGTAAVDKGVPKKIAGKYDSPEHAIESIDKAITTNFHETREQMTAIQNLLERALNPGTTKIGDPDDDRGSDYSRGYRTDNLDDDIDTTEFLSRPGKVLSAREKKQREQSRKESAAIASNIVANATTVLRFQMKNPDLDEHEALVSMFMREADQNKPLAKNLEEAAKKTRAYLKNLKGEKEDEGDLEADEQIESPANKAVTTTTKVEGENEDDDSLAAEIKMRRDQRTARFKTKEAK